MARTKRRAGAGSPEVTSVTVCQACWAGDSAEVIGSAPICGLGERPDVRTRGIDCFGVCEGDSVGVVQPSVQGRCAGGRPCWLREIHDPDVIEAVAGWLEAGGPGLADEPDLVAIHAFTPSRRIRTEHEDT